MIQKKKLFDPIQIVLFPLVSFPSWVPRGHVWTGSSARAGMAVYVTKVQRRGNRPRPKQLSQKAETSLIAGEGEERRRCGRLGLRGDRGHRGE